MNENKFCKLCLDEKKLKKSHIIPEFIYSEMYDENHKYKEISTDSQRKNKRHPKGIYEKLLCESCELKLSRWENYVSKLLKGGLEFSIKSSDKYHMISEIDSLSLRLFQLSILWRASVSSAQFFGNVTLECHEEKIQKLLLLEDYGLTWQYGCIMYALISDQSVLTDLIIQPDRMKCNGHLVYRFIFGGFIWLFFVSNHATPKEVQSYFTSQNNSTKILFKDVEKLPYLRDLAVKLFKNKKLDGY
jgi:hypothetical protein